MMNNLFSCNLKMTFVVVADIGKWLLIDLPNHLNGDGQVQLE